MNLSHQTQAILLLTAHFGKLAKTDPKPLTPTEWGRFAQWLREHTIQPETLVLHDPAATLADWHDSAVTLERIIFLLNRAGALGLATEKWERAGLWVLPRSDPHYPPRLKQRLSHNAPAILFGCGTQGLLNQGGLAVIGSRDVNEQDLSFTAALGGDAARQAVTVVSGGARGVDEAAMLGALEQDGAVVGVLADGLLRAATSAKYRTGLMAGNLVLVSPFNPEAGFDVGNAMSRNKYIYCLADAAIVTASSNGKGGTWNGAVENLKAGWVPLWVKQRGKANGGNAALVAQGAQWLPDDVAFAALYAVTLPDAAPEPPPAATNQQHSPQTVDSCRFYDLFLHYLEQLTAQAPATREQLATATGLHTSQLDAWLKQALADGCVQKLSRPVRYQWTALRVHQPPLLSDDTADAVDVGE